MNYPNPFNPTTTIEYQLPVTCHISIKVFNIIGQEINSLVDHIQKRGHYKIIWDGKNNMGKSVSSGLYIILMEADKFSQSHKILLIK